MKTAQQWQESGVGFVHQDLIEAIQTDARADLLAECERLKGEVDVITNRFKELCNTNAKHYNDSIQRQSTITAMEAALIEAKELLEASTFEQWEAWLSRRDIFLASPIITGLLKERHL